MGGESVGSLLRGASSRWTPTVRAPTLPGKESVVSPATGAVPLRVL